MLNQKRSKKWGDAKNCKCQGKKIRSKRRGFFNSVIDCLNVKLSEAQFFYLRKGHPQRMHFRDTSGRRRKRLSCWFFSRMVGYECIKLLIMCDYIPSLIPYNGKGVKSIQRVMLPRKLVQGYKMLEKTTTIIRGWKKGLSGDILPPSPLSVHRVWYIGEKV